MLGFGSTFLWKSWSLSLFSKYPGFGSVSMCHLSDMQSKTTAIYSAMRSSTQVSHLIVVCSKCCNCQSKERKFVTVLWDISIVYDNITVCGWEDAMHLLFSLFHSMCWSFSPQRTGLVLTGAFNIHGNRIHKMDMRRYTFLLIALGIRLE